MRLTPGGEDSGLSRRSLGVIAGVLADRFIPDPQGPAHPVAVFGRYALWLEKYLYRKDSRAAGALYVAACVIPPTAATAVIARRFPAATLAVSLWASLGGSLLEKTGTRMADRLESGDVEAARELIPWMCSRDPALLDEPGIARATVESVAENTSDAAIASLFWAGVAGAPGVVAHRCVNTLDAMVGYRNERYRRFGTPAALLDDALAYLPARLTACIHAAVALQRGRGGEALRAWREDAPHHPSPNAGPVESTAAAALGTRLGGKTVYAYGTEMRPVMGRGDPPTEKTIRDAVTLSRVTQAAAAGVAVVISCVLQGVQRRVRQSRQ